MNTRLAVELSKLDVVGAVTALKAEVDALRPLPPETEQRILQKFRLDWNYHSNSIEGNQLNYGETVAFLMHGLTAKGKPLKDHLDIRGHNQAIEFLMSLVKEDRGISEADIRGLHRMILVEPYEVDALTPDGQPTKKVIRLGEYKRESNSVRTRTGEIHYYATPEETPARMQNLMAWYGETKTNPDVHPLVLSALFHHEFTAIHPFDDGNGRMARLLSNLILMQSGYLPVVIKKDRRDGYYSALSQADVNRYIPLVEFFADLLRQALETYVRGANGYTIEEESDIDKEIDLFKASLEPSVFSRVLLSKTSFQNVFFNSIVPIFQISQIKLSKFIDLFFEFDNQIIVSWEREIRSGLFNDDGLSHYQIYNYNDELESTVDGKFILNQEHIYKQIFEMRSEESIERFKRDVPHSISFNFFWRGFKNSNNYFNCALNVQVIFTEYQYHFALFSKNDIQITIKKYYNEPIDGLERTEFVNRCAKSVLDEIKNKLNESVK